MAYSKSSSYWKGTTIILGSQWGDEGKGKIVDVGAQYADLVIRFGGGPNAGHTVKNKLGEFKLHLIPSGIFNKKTLNILTSGVIINPLSLVEEIKALDASGIKITPKNLLISESAHMILPWHKVRDKLSEVARGGKAIGTTGQGIGPAYSDRTARVGLRVGDLLKPDFEEIFKRELVWQEKLTQLMESGIQNQESSKNHYDKNKILEELTAATKILKPLITNVLPIMWEYQKKKKTIVGEGAQGALLDIDLGGYPFVTSSNTTAAGFMKSTGIYTIDKIVGVTKAYTTRVGSGPMPTELTDEIGKYIQTTGHEIGVTTGRVRRVGWFDPLIVGYGAKISGVTHIALTKLDVLDQFSEIKICTGYKIDGKLYTELPMADAPFLEKAKPVYMTLAGWKKDTSKIKEFKLLPPNAKKYIKKLEELLNLPIDIVSTHPDRTATIYK